MLLHIARKQLFKKVRMILYWFLTKVCSIPIQSIGYCLNQANLQKKQNIPRLVIVSVLSGAISVQYSCLFFV